VARFVSGKFLLPIEREQYRLPGLHRECGGQYFVLGRFRLGTEAAAHGDLTAHHLVVLETQQMGDLLRDKPRRLCRGPELDDAASLIPRRECDVRLHTRVRDARIDEPSGHCH
jgi:hypothetical protein